MSILLLLIVCLIGGSAYFMCPLPVQLILWVINFLVPDPIPFLDEIIMTGGILSKLFWLDNAIDNAIEFVQEHKIPCILAGIILITIIRHFVR